MFREDSSVAALSGTADQVATDRKNPFQRRSFLKGLGVVGAALSVGSLLTTEAEAQDTIAIGDVAILRFLAAAEILETDLWQQYNELGGIVDSELLGGKVI